MWTIPRISSYLLCIKRENNFPLVRKSGHPWMGLPKSQSYPTWSHLCKKGRTFFLYARQVNLGWDCLSSFGHIKTFIPLSQAYEVPRHIETQVRRINPTWQRRKRTFYFGIDNTISVTITRLCGITASLIGGNSEPTQSIHGARGRKYCPTCGVSVSV